MIASTNFAPLFSYFPTLYPPWRLSTGCTMCNTHGLLQSSLICICTCICFWSCICILICFCISSICFFFICLCCFCFWWITNFSNRTKKLFSWFWKTNADEIFHQDIRATRRALHVKVCDQCNSFWLSPDLGQPSPDLDVAAGWSTMYCWSRLALGPPDQSLKGAVTSNFSPGPKNKLPN